ncbi:MAG: hypothetical protein HUU21_18885 [Polyangiaceae bacterium]|nr:hypothetical protein [Polyangiaceae bacterium]
MDIVHSGRQVAWLGDRVFVVRSGVGVAELAVYPIDFTGDEQAISAISVCDGLGFLTAGPSRVYYRPQNAGNACDSTYEDLHSCDAAFMCNLTKYAIPNHINGLAVVGSDIYFTMPLEAMYKDTLSPEGIPAGTDPLPIQVELMVQPGLGAFLLSYDPKRDALWWTTYEGCIYQLPRSMLPQSSVGCFGQTAPSFGPLLISPNDFFYLGGVSSGIYVVNPESKVPEPATAFGSPDLRLRAVDSDYVFAYDGANPSLVALRHGSGEERARLKLSEDALSVDARHPKYVFFVAGSMLYRWRKPLP